MDAYKYSIVVAPLSGADSRTKNSSHYIYDSLRDLLRHGTPADIPCHAYLSL